MKNEMNIDLDIILKEDNSLQKINLPTINQSYKEQSKGYYIFQNKEGFRGKIINNKLEKGKYTWPNGQIFLGSFSENMQFNNKGKIIFPNNEELTGNFKPENNEIEKAIYKTENRIYQGSFKNNKLHGKFIIKNNENKPHYLFIGSYLKGFKDGKFSLETIYNAQKFRIAGKYYKGKKNGEFKIFLLKDKKVNEKEVETTEIFLKKLNIINDIIQKEYEESDKIEKRKSLVCNEKEKKNLYCMKIYKEVNKFYLLLGSYEKLLIYDINNEEKEINFDRSLCLFKNEDINDILILKDGKILLCGSKNSFKLIELNLTNNKKDKSTFTISTSYSNENDFIILQNFKGLSNSQNIFSLIELTNELIVSGDCQNIIVWKKNYSYENNNISIKSGDIYDINENSKINNEYLINKIKSKNLSHTYSMLEIKNENNRIILAVAQPDSEKIIFLQISPKDEIKEIESIDNISSIPNRKHIMTKIKKDLLIGSRHKIIVIDINIYKITSVIYIDSKTIITYINYYNDYLLLGLMKKINSYDYEGYLSQKEYVPNSPKQNAIIFPISDLKEIVHKGNIIDVCEYKFYNSNKEKIISIGTDGKILILN